MAENMPPDWAIERALQLAKAGGQMYIPSLATVKGEAPYVGYLVFARYIAEHEEPPADPIVEAFASAVSSLGTGYHEMTCHECAEFLVGELRERGIKLAKGGDQ